jgi:hypothetical protein
MAFFLASTPGRAQPVAIGVVVQADHASLDFQAATEGTTIYDGDRLSTGTGGSLRLLVGEAIIYLTDQRSVVVHNDASRAAKEFAAELVSGAVVLSATAGTAAEIIASSARVIQLQRREA